MTNLLSNIKIAVPEKIYIKDPETSQLGKKIIEQSIILINNQGFDNFNFKKLGELIGSNESSIYRYFENKHRLLLYILNWYWSYMSFLVDYELKNIKEPKQQLKAVIHLLTHELPDSAGDLVYNKKWLNQIVISESSKVYLVKEVKEINKAEVFLPYKELCASIAAIIELYNPKYKYPKSLTSTIIEASHHEQFFIDYLPRLTDVQAKNKSEFVANFLEDMLFKTLA